MNYEEEMIESEIVGDEEEFIDEELDDFLEEELKEFDKLDSQKEKPTKVYGVLAKERNMYFDEEYVSNLIINEYQPSLKYDDNGKLISRDTVVEAKIMAELEKVGLAIINKYSYWRFEPTEDLLQEELTEAFKYLPKFNTSKGTAFNLFSIIFKRHLLNYTLRKKKHRLLADIDIHQDLETKQDVNYNIFFQEMEESMLRIIDSEYKDTPKYQKYIECCAILMEYLVKTKTIIGKTDVVAWFRSYGYKSTDYKEFISILLPHKDLFYGLV